VSDLHINALLTEIGVNMGDHGQDVTRAVVVSPDMTVRGLCEKYLMKVVTTYGSPENGFKMGSETVPDDGKHLTIRLATEVGTPDGNGPF
jgi:hypothetical protein